MPSARLEVCIVICGLRVLSSLKDDRHSRQIWVEEYLSSVREVRHLEGVEAFHETVTKLCRCKSKVIYIEVVCTF